MPAPINESQKKELIKLGERIKSIRESKGLSLEEVANAVGKDRQSIHRLEKANFNPSYIYLLEICKGLGVQISELFSGLK
jgi:transcriptional regulator with XRE-family HTH domain